MDVWRITRAAYSGLDGEGARRAGGRWNSQGVPVVYTSSTLALAALEYLVHIDPEDVPDDLIAIRISIPDDLKIERVESSGLPSTWNEVPDHPACVRRGDAWVVAGASAILAVPSVIIPEERNILINPRHPGMPRIEAVGSRPFVFEPRLLNTPSFI